MGICSVGTFRYKVDIGRLLCRRVQRLGSSLDVKGGEGLAEADIASGKELKDWCAAVAELISLDLFQFEMTRMVNELPVSLEEKKAVLPEAVCLGKGCACPGAIEENLMEYFSKSSHLVLEGYIDFRMKKLRREWERCVLKAADELFINAEYLELMRVMAAFVQMRGPRLREVYLVLNPDGSCTFSDEQDVRIDYERCTGDGIMGVLMGLAPEHITVYDLSGGKSAALFDHLVRVFDGRICFF